MPEIKFKVGDVATLKSGSPDLTVSEVYTDGNVYVSWITEERVSTAVFPQECLVKKEV